MTRLFRVAFALAGLLVVSFSIVRSHGRGHLPAPNVFNDSLNGVAQPPRYSVPVAIRRAEVVALHAMPLATYDNTGESAHPDFVRATVPWSDDACWLVFTPYAGSAGALENPSLASSPDCEHWLPARGVRAPLIDKPDNGFNSDPDIVYDSTRGCMGVIFRQVTNVNSIVVMKSCDGTTWSAPRELFSKVNHGAISPSLATGPDGFERIWYVDAGVQGCGSRTSTVEMRRAIRAGTELDHLQFGDEVATNLAQPGYVIWHIDVAYVPSKHEYWAMYAAYPLSGYGGCLEEDVFLATSGDGRHWRTYRAPLLDRSDDRFTFASLYRGSFEYDAEHDQLRTIVSAREEKWGQYTVVHDYSALKTALDFSRTASATALAPLGRHAPKQAFRSVRPSIFGDHH
jgi:hypothetical protein